MASVQGQVSPLPGGSGILLVDSAIYDNDVFKIEEADVSSLLSRFSTMHLLICSGL